MKKSCSKAFEKSSLFNREYENFNDYLENGLLKSAEIPLDFKAIVNLIFVGDFMKSHFEMYLERYFDLSIPQKNILESLVFSKKESMTQKELSSFVFTSKGNLSSLLERMEKKELVERIVLQENKREKHVKITSKGKNLLSKVQTQIENSSFDKTLLSEKDASELQRILLELKPKFEEYFN